MLSDVLPKLRQNWRRELRPTLLLILFGGISVLSTSCQSIEARIAQAEMAAAAKARAEAKTNLPPLPEYCREKMGQVIPRVGEPVWGPQERWQGLRAKTNERIDWCAQFYDDVRDSVAKPPDGAGKT